MEFTKMQQETLTVNSRRIGEMLAAVKQIVTEIKQRNQATMNIVQRVADASEVEFADDMAIWSEIAENTGDLTGPALDSREVLNGSDVYELYKIGAATAEVWDMIVEGNEGEPYTRGAMAATALQALTKAQLNNRS